MLRCVPKKSRVRRAGTVLPSPAELTTCDVMPRQSSPAHDWCFTINNPRRRDYKRVQSWQYNYLVYQLELGEQGTPHIQGFVQFTTKQRLKALKKVHRTAHWEPRRGSAYQAAHYCKKPETGCDCHHCLAAVDVPRPQLIFESGTISAPAGEKLNSVAMTIKKRGLCAAIEAYPTHYMGMTRGMQALATFYSPRRSWRPVVTVLYGQPGSGKTRYAMLGPSPYVQADYPSKGSQFFFGDYRPDQHETLVFDDFYGQMPYSTWLRVCDRYPMEVHTKGGFHQLLTHNIVFTSNRGPREWYPKVFADLDRWQAFDRRIDNVIVFTEYGYQIKKGNLPWPLPHLDPLNSDQVLMNPAILHLLQNQPQVPHHDPADGKSPSPYLASLP